MTSVGIEPTTSGLDLLSESSGRLAGSVGVIMPASGTSGRGSTPAPRILIISFSDLEKKKFMRSEPFLQLTPRMIKCLKIPDLIGNVGFLRRGENRRITSRSREENQQQTQLTYGRRVRESNPGHIGGRRALSPLCHPCSPTCEDIVSFLSISYHSVYH